MEKTLKNFKRVAKIMEEKHAILKFKLVIHVFCLLCPESYYNFDIRCCFVLFIVLQLHTANIAQITSSV